MVKIYTYKNCGSCKKAISWLKENSIPFEQVAIREVPPSIEELTQARQSFSTIRKLFNTSGVDYRTQNLKEKLEELSESDAIALLHSNGNLVKRPFCVQENIYLVGFKADEWASVFELEE